MMMPDVEKKAVDGIMVYYSRMGGKKVRATYDDAINRTILIRFEINLE